jgi:hypothetical protein
LVFQVIIFTEVREVLPAFLLQYYRCIIVTTAERVNINGKEGTCVPKAMHSENSAQIQMPNDDYKKNAFCKA